ncbi:MAG: matrixin family metalloprotease [Phycisphaerae bacterium]|nr:matrixin family metalloprotease [Phycisphaerae bacterium]
MRISGLHAGLALPIALTLVGAFQLIDINGVEGGAVVAAKERGEERASHACGAPACRNFAGGSACFAPGTSERAMSAALARLPAGSAGFSAVNRWTSTATNGSIASGPITLTYSFVPDVNTGDNETSNNIHALLDGQFGSRSVWKNLFAQIFADWSEVSGITFVETVDDGASWPDTPGVIGVRGDVRIVAQPIDGGLNTLAFNYFPNSGDMTLDSAEDWNDPTDGYRFLKNTLMHELGHGLGLEHVNPRNNTKLMEALLNTNFEGPQDDDIRGVQSYYGDPHEPNDTTSAIEPLGAYSNGASFNDLSLHNTSDVDYLRITGSSGQSIDFTVTPVGASYNVGPDPGTPAAIDTRRIQRLRLRLYRANGTTLLADETPTTLGDAVTASAAVQFGDTSIVAVVSSASGSNTVQRYSLSLAPGAAALMSIQVSSDAPSAVSASFSPADNNGLSSAALPATVAYFQGTSVQFTAPASSGGVAFSRWSVDGVLQSPGVNPLTLPISSNHALVARYSNALAVDAGSDVAINLGSSTTLSANVAGGVAPYSYVWSPSAGLNQTSGASVVATPTDTTTYTVTVTDAVGTSASGSVVVTVVRPLTANAGPDQFVGAGVSGAMAGSASGGVAPYAYAWSPATGLTSITNPTTPFTIFVARTYTLTVTDAEGSVATDTVTLSPAAALSLSVSASASTIASGGSATLSASVSGGATPYDIVWTANGVNVGEGSSISVSPSATTSYTVNVADASGQTESLSLTVNVAAALSVALDGPSSPVAEGSAISLTATVSGGVAPYSYAWSPASAVASPAAATTSATVNQTTTFAVDVTDALGQTARAERTVSVGGSVGGQGIDDGNDGSDSGVGGGAVVPMVGPCGLTSLSLLGFAAMSIVRSRRR